MLKNIIDIEIEENKKGYSIEYIKELKRELTKKVYNVNDDFIINAYFKDWNKFIKLMIELNNKSLSSLTRQEIKLINFINKIDTITLNQLRNY